MMRLWSSRGISRLVRLKLLKAAEREIRFEESQQAESGFLTRYLGLHNYSVLSKPGADYMVMERVQDDYTVRVKIKARTVAVDISKEDAVQLVEKDKGESDQEEDKLLPDTADFTILIQRRQKDKQVLVTCSTRQSVLFIHQISIGTNVESSNEVGYEGPYFQLLSKPLQTQLVAVFRWLGIDGDLAKAAETLSLMKENEEYVRWLRSITDFTSKE